MELQVRFVHDHRYVDDSGNETIFKAGETHSLPLRLGESFITMRVAEHANQAMTPPETQAVSGAPEVKEVEPVDLTKLRRAELDQLAEQYDLDPSQFGNKADLIEALEDAGA